MRLISLLVFLSGSSAAGISRTSKSPAGEHPFLSNRFIVEIDDVSQFSGPRRTSPHEGLYNTLRQREVMFQVDREYHAEGLFVGSALTIPDAETAFALVQTPGIKAIRPISIFPRPEPVSSQATPDSLKNSAGDVILPDTQSTHVMTGVDKLHADGFYGEGIRIGVIDSGVDYTHPVLGKGFGPNFKIAGGYDFVGDSYDGSNQPQPDDDPLDQCAGHGTHVAGIIGADPGGDYNISGVAYAAKQYAYRVFGCSGTATDDIIVDAMLRAVADGNDILSLSLGSLGGWSESTSAVVASRIATSGRVVTIAAGNSGVSGSWYTSSPGTGQDVISVGSVDNTMLVLQNATVHGVDHAPITYFRSYPISLNGSLPIYATSTNLTITDDACAPLPDETPDLSKYITIIRRGNCTLLTKLANVDAKGGKYALIYNNSPNFTQVSTGNYSGAALIRDTDGEFLVKSFIAGDNVALSFPRTGASTQLPDPNGGLVSYFTSYGPSYDLDLKPSIVAPGGNILSTVPTTRGLYVVFSGTSMATPFAAGAAALIMEVKGKNEKIARSVRALLETTAMALSSNVTDGYPLQTVTQQGAGLINVYKAAHATTLVTPSRLLLNDSAHYVKQHTITIENTDKEPKTYKFGHVAAGTALTVQSKSNLSSLWPVPLITKNATVSFGVASLTLAAGSKETLQVTIDPPTGVDASTYPAFSGFIEISDGTPENTHHVTYLGLGASLKDKTVLDVGLYNGTITPSIVDVAGKIQNETRQYNFTNNDYPTLLFRLNFGSPFVRGDLIDAGANVTKREQAYTFSFREPPANVEGRLFTYDYLPRNNADQMSPSDNGYYSFSLETPTFANGSNVPSGSYRIQIQTLRVTGNASKEEDYDVWKSPVIVVP